MACFTVQSPNGRLYLHITLQDGTLFWNADMDGVALTKASPLGIRLEGCGLAVSNCLFFANENGILTGASETGRVQIVDSVFRGNGAEDGYSHNIYVGAVQSLEMVRCKSDHALAGHCLKSRARASRIIDCVFRL